MLINIFKFEYFFQPNKTDKLCITLNKDTS